jgi:hypothetical protein
MSRIFETLRQAEQERRAAVPEMPPAAVDREQAHAAAASLADLAETGHKEILRLVPQVVLSANGSAPRQLVSYGADDDERRRAGATPASTERLPDLQAFLATAYLLSKSRQPLSRTLAPAGAAQLFSSLVSLQRQAADLELEVDEVLASVAHHARALTRSVSD